MSRFATIAILVLCAAAAVLGCRKGLSKIPAAVAAKHAHDHVSKQKAAKPADAHVHSEPRSPEWPRVRAFYLKVHPTCEACGEAEAKYLEVHHVIPFSHDKTKELDSANLITLCTHPARNCHLNIGHSGDFKAANPHVREDAALMLKRRKERVYPSEDKGVSARKAVFYATAA